MKITGERYTTTPDKNFYSNVADALGYGGTRFFGTHLLNRSASDDYRSGSENYVGGGRAFDDWILASPIDGTHRGVSLLPDSRLHELRFQY